MREQSIFIEAVEKESPGERTAFLDQACAGDPALRQRIERLLERHQQADEFLESPAVALAATGDGPPREQPGSMIGPYKLLEQIGEGGFGVVFMAEQHHPMRRKIALKVIKPGMDTRQVIARFEAERQALALMDHPNIAHVLDAGETTSGRPYFVMELIRGVPITRYCDQNNSKPRERLELFVSVCQAVQHAHQKGIIHRDLKPSNVMVTLHDGSPVVKVIDFGIAKAIGQRLTEKTLFTNFAHMVGTPMYMSPEQAEMSGLDVDTRTDIYSLGVLLYELLTGTTPFDGERLLEAGFDEVRRIIREEDPPRPSARISTLGQALDTVSAERKTECEQLGRLMRGELDWIVMKALCKDRRRRYETASAFAADVQHFLNNEPVSACPPSAFYRFRKFASRHKAPMMAAVITVVALLVGTAVSTWQAVRATTAEGLADARLQAETAERLQAVAAKQVAKRRLFDARLAQAGASRMSRQPGQRFESWRAVTEAAKLARELGLGEEHRSALRDEAVACLALPDVRPIKGPWEVSSSGASSLVEFDPDLKHYARSDSQGTVSIHNVDDDSELARLSGPVPASLTFSPDGAYLAIQQPSSVLVWDWQRNATIFQTPLPAYNVAIGFSPNRELLAVGQRDETVRVYELPSGTERKRFALGILPMHLAFHPSGASLAVNGGHEVQVRDVATGEVIRRLSLPVITFHVAWHEDGILLAATGDDHEVYVWDTVTGRLQMKGPHARPRRVAFAAGGDLLLSWGGDDTSRLWNPWTAQELLRVPGAGSQLSRDGHRLATQSGTSLTLWELAPGLEYRTLPRLRVADRQTLWEGDISPDGRWLAQGTDQGLLVWDLARRKQLALLPVSRVTHAKFHPSGKELFTSGPSGLFRWAVDAQAGVLRIGPPSKLPVSGYSFLERIGLDRSARTLAVADLYAGCHVLDLDNPTTSERLFVHGRAIWAAVSPDGRWVVSSTHNGSGIKVWDVATGREVRDLAPENRAAAVTFSPDGRWLLTATNTDFVIWGVGSWARILRIPRDQSFDMGSAAFSRDGKVLAVTMAPSSVHLIDPSTGRHLARLQALETGWLSLIGFSPDGSQLAASGIWDTCVWDLRRIGEQLREIGLDWGLPSFGPAPPAPEPVRVEDASGYDFGSDVSAYVRRAGSLVRQAKWAQAAADMEKVADLSGPLNQKVWYDLAVLRLAADDVAGYRWVCREMLTRFGPDNPNVAERTAKTCLLAPDAVTDYEPVMRLAQHAVKGTDSHQDYKWFALARGMADYRSDNFSGAIEWLSKSLSPGAENPYRDGLAQLFLAMAHHRLGQADDARQAMEQARAMEQKLPKFDAGDESWPDALQLHIVRREAERLLMNEDSGIRNQKEAKSTVPEP